MVLVSTGSCPRCSAPHPLFLISAHTPFPLPQSLKVPSLRYLPIMLPLCERGGNHWNEANHLLAGMI